MPITERYRFFTITIQEETTEVECEFSLKPYFKMKHSNRQAALNFIDGFTYGWMIGRGEINENDVNTKH